MIKNIYPSNHTDAIEEIAVRNELPPSEVRGIYRKINTQAYVKNLLKNGEFRLYNPLLMRLTYNLTEKYIDNKRFKEFYKEK